MALPVEERLRILEQRVAALSEQIYYAHPIEDEVFHGVVLRIENNLEPEEGNDEESPVEPESMLEIEGEIPTQTWLVVAPYAPLPPDDAGNLAFDQENIHPLQSQESDTRYDKVYPLNIPPDMIGLYFSPGMRIKYWRYSGTLDQADEIRGSYVTLVEDEGFWAVVEDSGERVDDGANSPIKYTFRALSYRYDITDDGFDDLVARRFLYYDISTLKGNTDKDASTIFTGDCCNIREMMEFNRFDKVLAVPTRNPMVVRMKKYVPNREVAPMPFEWYFSAEPQCPFLVQVLQTGGSAGNATTECSFTYKVMDVTGTYTYATSGVQLVGSRFSLGRMTAGQFGIAYFDADGELWLVWVDEQIATHQCDS